MNRVTPVERNFATSLGDSATADNGFAQTQGIEVDFRAIWGAFRRNRLLIAIILLLALAGGVLITVLTPREYRAVATVQIEQRSSKVLSTEENEPQPQSSEADRFLQTQIGLLNSRALAAQVVESLGLARDQRTLLQMGLPESQLPAANNVKARHNILVGLVQGNLTVTLPRDSRIAQIGFTSASPQLAARIANGYAEAYIVYNMRRRFQDSSYARSFLQDQLDDAKGRLEESERSLVAYARGAQLFDVGASGQGSGSGDNRLSSLTTASMLEFNTALSQAQTARIDAQRRWEQAQQTPVMSLPEVLGNATVQELTQRIAVAKASYEQERQRRKPDYPSMQQADAQIKELNDQLSALAGTIRSSLKNRYQIAQDQEDALASKLNQLKSETLTEQDRSIQYNILRRQVETNRLMYDGLLQRYKEVSAAAGVTANNISIVDRAEVPNVPITPRLSMNLASAGAVGLALALLLVSIREKIDDTIRTPEDVEHKLGLRMLDTIPSLPAGASPLAALEDPRSPMSEAFLALRTLLDHASPSGIPRSMALASSRPSEGKSTSAYAIARDFSRTGKRVLLVDGDLRKPSLHRFLGLPNDRGLVSVLNGEMGIEEAVQTTQIQGLSFLGCGPMTPIPAELLSDPALARTFTQLRESYDLVVVDSPPVLGLADSVLLGSNVDATLFIVEANNSRVNEVRMALQRLQSNGITVMGAVLNKFDKDQMHYSYP